MVVESEVKVVKPVLIPAMARPREVKPAPAVQPRVMVATHGNMKLFRFALAEAKAKQAELFALFVRHIAVPTMGPANVADVKADAEALAVLQQIEAEATAASVRVHSLYAVAYDVPEAILEFAATHSIDILILGASQRGALWHAMKGDVISQVAEYLPERINLLIHA
jgi:nucleotide-binding universal stress UspA family protein